MNDRPDNESHGVHAAPREDGGPQEAPAAADEVDDDLAEVTDTGADAS